MARRIASKFTTVPTCPQAREQGRDQLASRAKCNALDPSWLSPIPLSQGEVRANDSPGERGRVEIRAQPSPSPAVSVADPVGLELINLVAH